MFRKLRWLIGLSCRNWSAKRLLPTPPPPPPQQQQQQQQQLPTLDATHEIAIYIHRFHNLDLYQKGWYRIRITVRWEGNENTYPGTPARVVQYEVAAPELSSDNFNGGWGIDDIDNSFSTRPFLIRDARQDVFLSVLISFNLALGKNEGPSTTAVILKFELMYAPVLNIRPELQASLEPCSVAVHEFLIPPNALLGMHSYCPVHFDASHAVLVDISVHVSLLRTGSYIPPLKVPSATWAVEDDNGQDFDGSNKALGQKASGDLKQIMLVKALVAARDILFEDLQKISKAIEQEIDLTDLIFNLDNKNLCSSIMQADLDMEFGEVSRKLSGKPQNSIEKAGGIINFQSEKLLQSLPQDYLFSFYYMLGNQVLFLWNAFLKFHRVNKTKILELLRDAWANDRRAEWSIWMVYSKVEMPHGPSQYMSHKSSSYHSVNGKSLSLRKSTDAVNPANAAAMRAELHRQSIARMRINNQSLQDMHLFGDPLHTPIVIVEHIISAPLRTTSLNSYFNHLDQKDTRSVLIGPSFKASSRSFRASPQQDGPVLKIVVFVHGFQGHHLDLRLVRNQWLQIDPKIKFLMSEANEDKTFGELGEMGLRLAQEVISFLKKKIDKASRCGSLRSIKLSFVGHSIGNLIIRTALAESIMEPYLRYLYTYLSISGPHLGYLYSSNSLFNSGLWLLKKLKGAQCIHQLTLTDNPDLHDTFLYKLCKKRTLQNFRNVILLSSPQDGYVPYHSARIEMCPAASLNYSKKSSIFMEMLNNCLDQIRSPSSEHRVFMRCDVNFDTSLHGRNLNSFIGRAAHIEFLESDIFARLIMWSFADLFH
ncbi:protein FAM135B-like isoform X2 [Quercus lobata]|uniref:protein FAM135B-like isoform X2 n=1 Tax=Quercus lobata TaxID=97700 RepID=UPI001246EE7B|nr:protein FAM135B-like isoform X2 [Quercus lobata]